MAIIYFRTGPARDVTTENKKKKTNLLPPLYNSTAGAWPICASGRYYNL